MVVRGEAEVHDPVKTVEEVLFGPEPQEVAYYSEKESVERLGQEHVRILDATEENRCVVGWLGAHAFRDWPPGEVVPDDEAEVGHQTGQ